MQVWRGGLGLGFKSTFFVGLSTLSLSFQIDLLLEIGVTCATEIQILDANQISPGFKEFE